MGVSKGISIDTFSSETQTTLDFGYQIPVSLFLDRSLSVFEVLIEFLKDTQNLSYHEIAVLTNRDDRTIWTIYSRVQKKRQNNPRPTLKQTKIYIPLSVLLDRSVAVLEAVVFYLRERRNFSIKEISEMLGRSDRTIWTVYSRAKKKLANEKKD